MAMTAAETGHLVLGTLHTTSATKTIDRIIDALPVEEREQTKAFLSQSLLAVVTTPGSCWSTSPGSNSPKKVSSVARCASITTSSPNERTDTASSPKLKLE